MVGVLNSVWAELDDRMGNRSIAFPKAQIAARVNRVLLCQTLRVSPTRIHDRLNQPRNYGSELALMVANVCFAGRQIVYPEDRASPPRNHFPDIPYRFGEPTTRRNKLAFLVLSTHFLFCFVFFFSSFFSPFSFFSSLFSFFFFLFFTFIFYSGLSRETYRIYQRMFHLANENLDDRDRF